MYNMIVA